MTPACRYKLRDRRGDYVGTFVSDARTWRADDIFTTGDGRVLRVVGVAAVPERSPGRPAYSGGLIVEAVERAG